ncbi:MAG: RpiB/LacA/LacB family sugar-phosphate isomerase, partial [Anaerolineales bacterium]|nr:RpiB/LacA/LacB family sugar-phosphate isomerase [Anaerolineales bacterium]
MPDEKRIREMVRKVVHRTLGLKVPNPTPQRRVLVTELEIRDLPYGSTFAIPKGAMITPLAQQIALDLKVKFVEATIESPASALITATLPAGRPHAEAGVIAIGADHGGYKLKEELKIALASSGYSYKDCGTHSEGSVDYPDFAFAVAELVASGTAWRGIIIDGAGIGSCMAANKVPGVLAAMCFDQATAINSREHNNA